MNTPSPIFTHLEEFDGKSKKLRGGGFIKYSIYKDARDELYILTDENWINKPNKGRLTHKLFPLSTVMTLTPKNRKNPIGGYDRFSGEYSEHRNLNTSAFLRAVLKTLMENDSEILNKIHQSIQK